MHLSTQRFWLPGQAQRLLGLQIWPETALQSALVQQPALGMHLVPQIFCPVTHAQVPFGWHLSPWIGQSLSTQQAPLSTQVLLAAHVRFPAGQAQVKPWQVWPATEVHCPASQQLPLTQNLPHFMMPVPVQVQVLAVPLQDPPGPQSVPTQQSKAPDTQEPSHIDGMELGQAHVPAWQVWPATMALHSASSQQAATGMHFFCASQRSWPAGHSHWPAWQTSPSLGHATEGQHEARSMQRPSHSFCCAEQTQTPCSQTCPTTAVQSSARQQPPARTQPSGHGLPPAGHSQLPWLQICPATLAVHSSSVQQSCAGMHCPLHGLLAESHSPASSGKLPPPSPATIGPPSPCGGGPPVSATATQTPSAVHIPLAQPASGQAKTALDKSTQRQPPRQTAAVAARESHDLGTPDGSAIRAPAGRPETTRG
jgi:hypothetical protein